MSRQMAEGSVQPSPSSQERGGQWGRGERVDLGEGVHYVHWHDYVVPYSVIEHTKMLYELCTVECIYKEIYYYISLVCICFPTPGRGLPYGSGLGLSR